MESYYTRLISMNEIKSVTSKADLNVTNAVDNHTRNLNYMP